MGGDGEVEPGHQPAQEVAGARREGGHEAAGAAPREEARDGGGGEEAPRRVEGVLQEHDGGVRGGGAEEGRGRGRGVSHWTDGERSILQHWACSAVNVRTDWA